MHYTCDRVGFGGTIGIDDLITGRGVPLNPGVFLGRNTPRDLFLPAGSTFTLSDPPGSNPGGPPNPY